MSTVTSTIEQVAQRYSTLRVEVKDEGQTQLKAPLRYNGSFDKHQFLELTPAIGRQYEADLQLVDLIHAEDKVLKDLAHIGTPLVKM